MLETVTSTVSGKKLWQKYLEKDLEIIFKFLNQLLEDWVEKQNPKILLFYKFIRFQIYFALENIKWC